MLDVVLDVESLGVTLNAILCLVPRYYVQITTASERRERVRFNRVLAHQRDLGALIVLGLNLNRFLRDRLTVQVQPLCDGAELARVPERREVVVLVPASGMR